MLKQDRSALGWMNVIYSTLDYQIYILLVVVLASFYSVIKTFFILYTVTGRGRRKMLICACPTFLSIEWILQI